MKRIAGFLILLGLVGCTGKTDPSPNMSQFTQVEVIEQGEIEGMVYRMFKDKRTGSRIMYLNQSMVVLPSEPLENIRMR